MQDIKDFEPLWGEWRSVEMLGRGSFGRVYKMVKKDLDQEYYAAVKHLSLPKEPDEDPYDEGFATDQETLKGYYEDALKDLRSEIDLCYKLKGYTNIVSYEDHYIQQKSTGIGYDIFIKMELLTSLKDRIREGRLPPWDVIKLGEDICSALTILRRERIIHRDIKPENIFINSGGDYKLGDFGVSKSMEHTVSNMSVKGTYRYMAPEVVKGDVGDFRVDIYSLGLVLYRMLNENRDPFLPPPPQPWKKKDFEIAQTKRLNGEPLPPPIGADETLGGIILKACAYRPEDRWTSPEEMGSELKKYRLSMKQATETSPVEPPPAEPLPAEPLPVEPLPAEPLPAEPLPAEPLPVEPLPAEPLPVEPLPAEPLPMEPPSGPNETIWLDPKQALRNSGNYSDTVKLRSDRVQGEGGGPSSDKPEKPFPAELLPDNDGMMKKTSDAGQNKGSDGPGGPKPQSNLRRKPGESATLSSTAAGKIRPPMIAIAGAVVLVGVIGVFALAPRSADSTPPSEPDISSGFQSSSASTQSQGNTPEPILWQDPFIRDGVLTALGTDEENLTPELLAGLEELLLPAPASQEDTGVQEELEPAHITTLADLSLLPGLKALDLSGHPVDNFDFPEEMSTLDTLKLADCGCTSLEFLTQTSLQNLQTLDLSKNEITDLTPLAGLTRLTELNISGTQTESLEPLRGLSELMILSAAEIPAEDWGPVDGVAHVEGRPEEPQQQKPVEPQNPSTATKPSTPSKPAGQPTEPTTAAVSSVSVSPSNVMLEVGGSIHLSASVSPANATNQTIAWSSSNPLVASVDDNGNVKAVDRGTARITASCDGKSGACTITVD